MTTTKLVSILVAAMVLRTAFCQLLQPRMIGGEPVRKDTLPWVASVKQISNGVMTRSCLGSILNNRFILSSALCVTGGTPYNTIVQFGQYLLSSDSSNSNKIQKIYSHRAFDPKTGKNDVALILLSTPIRFTKFVQPVSLGTLENDKDAQVTAIGWNEDSESGLEFGKPEPYKLATLDLNVLEIPKCKKKFPELDKEVHFDGNQICAYNGKGKDMCEVDYGGPLIDKKTNKQVGIFNDVIFAAAGQEHRCHPDHDHPLFFTRLDSYRAWINDMVHSSKYH